MSLFCLKLYFDSVICNCNLLALRIGLVCYMTKSFYGLSITATISL